MPSPMDKLVEAIIHRATLDREFRKKLLASPEAAVAEAFGVALPQGTRLKFIERDTDADYTHVLPDFRNQDDDEELTDEDLDAAAGGSEDWFGRDGTVS